VSSRFDGTVASVAGASPGIAQEPIHDATLSPRGQTA
jgi:hypothetical protein